MTKKFCTYALDLPVPQAKMPVVADVVEAALVEHEGELQPALVLEDGKAVVLSYGQMTALATLFRDWTTMIGPRVETKHAVKA